MNGRQRDARLLPAVGAKRKRGFSMLRSLFIRQRLRRCPGLDLFVVGCGVVVSRSAAALHVQWQVFLSHLSKQCRLVPCCREVWGSCTNEAFGSCLMVVSKTS
jgi:hypothetical protein